MCWHATFWQGILGQMKEDPPDTQIGRSGMMTAIQTHTSVQMILDELIKAIDTDNRAFNRSLGSNCRGLRKPVTERCFGSVAALDKSKP